MAEIGTVPGVSELEVASLKEALNAQQQLLQKLYGELDQEREASSSAASETLSMILRLQGEKAAVKMEASQYKRIAEEKMCHAEESLAIFEDLIFQKEMEIASLDFQVQAFRCKLLSLGLSDVGVGETKYPDHLLLHLKESFAEDVSVRGNVRRNKSLPPIPFKDRFHKKGALEGGKSPVLVGDLISRVADENIENGLNAYCSEPERKSESPDCGTFDSYWEQIKVLEEQVKGTSSSKVSVRRSLSKVKELSRSSSIQAEISSKEFDNCVGSSSIQDIFEVPQVCDGKKGYGKRKIYQDVSILERQKSLTKPFLDPPDTLQFYIDETDQVRKSLQGTGNENNVRKQKGGASTDCHMVSVNSAGNNNNFQIEIDQLSKRLEWLENERKLAKRESIETGEEEKNLLKEIHEQLNLIQMEIQSLQYKKSLPRDDDSLMVSLTKAMLHFWL